jgi:hypothetical protein
MNGIASILLVLTLASANTKVVKDDVIVVVVKSSGCKASNLLKQRFKTQTIATQIINNNQQLFILQGDKYPKYIKDHKIKFYPTTMRFIKRADGQYEEKYRFVGSKQIHYILGFLNTGLAEPYCPPGRT